MRHFLEVDDLSVAELEEVIQLANRVPASLGRPLDGLGVAAVFSKPSARTRNSTEMAVAQLGGHPVYITDVEVGIDTRESAEDVARTMACYHAAICARVFEHSVLDRMAATNTIPIINLLSDEAHPLQAIADVLTVIAEFGTVKDKVVTYIGDANNVTRSLALAVGMLGGEMRVVCPSSHNFSDVDADRIAAAGITVKLSDRVQDLVPGSDVIYTDTWVSMGQEAERDTKVRAFEGFQVNEQLMALAPGAIFMHCLPAHRGEEVSDGVMDGAQSRIWGQAANRLNSVRGILAWVAKQNADN